MNIGHCHWQWRLVMALAMWQWPPGHARWLGASAADLFFGGWGDAVLALPPPGGRGPALQIGGRMDGLINKNGGLRSQVQVRFEMRFGNLVQCKLPNLISISSHIQEHM